MDKQTHIIKQAKSLPIQTRKELVDAILESLKVDKERRLAQLIAIGEEVFGCTYNPDRKFHGDTLIRNCCAKVLRMEGYSYQAIGDAMKRHPSSVIYMAIRAEEMDAGYFGWDIRNKYLQFMKKAL